MSVVFPLASLKRTRKEIPDGFIDPERVRLLEDLLVHYTKSPVFEKPTLEQLVHPLHMESVDAASTQSKGTTINSTDSSNEDEDNSIDPVSSTTADSTNVLKTLIPK
ncbi:uncharacterized protein Z518_09224 [Rhinocladiella mackenziei CBS 650.93]|uniref:Uncharacterized protein n=1 Tax=Rhinocladiella mackenziei CBS 650.93 TaxID=1442369 RepID=A0A0D2GT46_9EURO|nr:uncharacterized protein Z518_09224 [Rhinocladiella mackenziei CBS 650.93]KIX01498.1 hypothetical protein Z518_09224 [Rhinocladiella mackenziei CBS 650.93]